MQKRAIAVHDISCVGRCSLTVALPILSAAGIETSVLPTALLSTHTGEFTGYTHLDLSSQLQPISEHLQSLNLTWDAFYSGYIASTEQVAQVLDVLERLQGENTHVFVDPAFADHGQIYALLGDKMPQYMKKLVEKADTIVPNLTEACFLLGKPYNPNIAPEQVEEICLELARLGPKQIIITGIESKNNTTSIVLYDRNSYAPRWLHAPLQNGIFHGTGDVFASFVLAGLLNDFDLYTSTKMALDLTQKSIQLTLHEKQPLRYGVRFEKVIPLLIEELSK